MLDTTTRVTVAGQAVLDEIAAHKAETVRQSTKHPAFFDSESLCVHQRAMAGRGYLGAEIVKSKYGYCLRYDSGLQGFGLIAGASGGRLDGSYLDAERFARAWQAEAPTLRYVTTFHREG